jgi:pimeloyl-ACP methyl ester carboxylesterase
VLFVHGTRDPFGTVDELREAIKLIPAAARLQVVEGAGHGVPPATAASIPEWLVSI